MGTKRFLIAALLGATMATPAVAQIDDEISDFGVWTSVGVEKKINKKWGVEFEGEFRTADALNEVARYSFSLSTDYKLTSWLKAEAGYVFLRDNNLASFKEEPIDEEDLGWVIQQGELTDAYWTTRHRVNVALVGSVKVDRVKISLRERWQYTYRPETSKTETDYVFYDPSLPLEPEVGEPKSKIVKGKGSNVLRSRLQVAYDIKGVPFEPYASVELYNDFKDLKLKKTRYTIGGDYKITKQHSVGLYYRYQDFSGNDEGESTHILGVGYKFKF